mmetsp:Transcript_10/g.40  ORF Transcript_10/g.40 Transcript_10/m.40 type:complete len:237 (+) Transcript_10:761-1471(+)
MSALCARSSTAAACDSNARPDASAFVSSVASGRDAASSWEGDAPNPAAARVAAARSAYAAARNATACARDRAAAKTPAARRGLVQRRTHLSNTLSRPSTTHHRLIAAPTALVSTSPPRLAAKVSEASTASAFASAASLCASVSSSSSSVASSVSLGSRHCSKRVTSSSGLDRSTSTAPESARPPAYNAAVARVVPASARGLLARVAFASPSESHIESSALGATGSSLSESLPSPGS